MSRFSAAVPAFFASAALAFAGELPAPLDHSQTAAGGPDTQKTAILGTTSSRAWPPHAAPRPAANTVSTRCAEAEVRLDENHSAALLVGCGDEYGGDLLWHLDRVDQVTPMLDGRYDPKNGGVGSVVYVMDTGVLAAHDEFARPDGGSRVIGGFDAASSVTIGASSCRSGDKSTAPCFARYEELAAASHGTGVASVIAGRRIGIAPRAEVVSIRVMNERGLATTHTYLQGLDAIIDHAWRAGAPPFRTAVVNISGWVLERLSSSAAGPVVPFATVENKIREMVSGVDANGNPDPDGKRFLFVVAGNNLDGGCGEAGIVDRFPAILGRHVEGVITVGGMTARNDWWQGACRGSVEVLAPAQQVFSASITARDHYRGRKPKLRSGTSFAAPVIAGIAARLLSDRSDLTPAQLETLITSTPSRIVDTGAAYAWGRVGHVTPTLAVPHAQANVRAETASVSTARR